MLAGVVALGLAATAGPVGAHEDGAEAPVAKSSRSVDNCPPAMKRQLKRAGDNFARGCLPGEDFGRLDDSDAELGVGETASSRNLELVANLPKSGAFASDTAYNSDLAFKGRYAFAGNYEGFTVYDISNAKEPREVVQVHCPGSQNDISVWKDLLVLSVDSSRNDDSCSSTSQSATEKSSWEGVRVFDISDPAAPEYVAAVETPCGSHTHTLAPTKNGRDLFVYVSSYSPNAAFPDCQPPHDLISVVKVPVGSPETASLASTPVLFPDGGQPAGGYSRETSGCHDITAYPSKDIAAGACMGDGILMDISDRANPVVTERTQDTENFAFWHSATFNNSGTKVVFTDELGGGGAATCNPTVGEKRGANGIYDIVRGKLAFRSYYKMPRTQSNTENCVAHNGSLIPVKGRDYMVQAWYQGGISVFDFTDSKHPRELAWFDRGPLSDEKLMLGGSWSAYWYNGHIFSNDIQQGFDVLELKDPRVKTASKVRMDVFNPQSQPSYNG
ncbi:LVIVD repeat-containing protein [Nocardioides pacificus]